MPSADTPLIQNDESIQAEPPKNKKLWIGVVLAVIILIIVAIAVAVTLGSSEDEVDPNGQGLAYKMEEFPLPEEYVSGEATGIRAVCNDLSENSYYFKDADEEEDAGNFVIYFPGGAGCWDTESCDLRYDIRAEDMTANEEDFVYGRGITNNGQLKGENPFAGWNMVWNHYCSSDAYIGRVDIDDPESLAPGVHFGGDAMFWGVIRALVDEHALGDAENIMITASSAGAEGLFQQMDRLIAFLAVEAPQANVKVAFDNGWHIYGIEPFNTTEEDYEDEDTIRQKQYDGWNANLNDNCVAAGEEYRCLYTASVLYPLLDNKAFHMHMHEFDFMQHSAYGIIPGAWLEWSDEELEYSVMLAEEIVKSLLDTDATLTHFTSPASREHDVFDKSGFIEESMPLTQEDEDYWAEGIPDDAVTIADCLWMFMEGDYDEPVRVYDACMEPYCNPTASILPYDQDDPEDSAPI